MDFPTTAVSSLADLSRALLRTQPCNLQLQASVLIENLSVLATPASRAMTAGVPATTLVNSVPIHPTVSELLPTLLLQLTPLV